MGTQYLEQIRKILPKDSRISDIDPYLLLLTRARKTDREWKTDPELLEYIQLKYGSLDYDRLEFLGDAVLELVIRSLLYDHYELATPGQLHRVKTALVNNRALACFSNELEFCFSNTKQCADIFEALIGAVYLHLRNKRDVDPIRWISDWLRNLLSLDSLIDRILYGIGNPDLYSCIPQYITQQINLSRAKMVSEQQRQQRLQELEAHLGVLPKEALAVESPQLGPAELPEGIDLSYEEKLEHYTDEVKQLPTNILNEMNRIISRELASRRPKTSRQLLKEFFDRNKFGAVKYVKLNPVEGVRHHIGVLCPRQICEGIMGDGVGQMLDEAREDASTNALNYLRKGGYLK